MIENEGSLDRVSQDVLAFVRKNRPQLVERARTVRDGDHWILEISLPAPNPKLKYPLHLTTENDELTLSFGGWHGHYAATSEDEIARVFSEFDAVLQDRVLAVTYARDGKWAGGMLVKSHEQIFTGYFEGFIGSVEVRSWTGSRDEDIQTA